MNERSLLILRSGASDPVFQRLLQPLLPLSLFFYILVTGCLLFVCCPFAPPAVPSSPSCLRLNPSSHTPLPPPAEPPSLHLHLDFTFSFCSLPLPLLFLFSLSLTSGPPPSSSSTACLQALKTRTLFGCFKAPSCRMMVSFHLPVLPGW